jgi:hypothetical protein
LSKNFAAAGETLVEMQDPLAWGNLQVTGCRIDQVKSLLDFSTSVYGITRVHEVLEDGTDTEHEYADNIDRALELGNKEDPDIIKFWPTAVTIQGVAVIQSQVVSALWLDGHVLEMTFGSYKELAYPLCFAQVVKEKGMFTSRASVKYFMKSWGLAVHQT